MNPNLFSKHTSIPTCANQFLYIVIFSKIPVSKPLIANEVCFYFGLSINFCAYFYYIAIALMEEELKEKNERLSLSVVRNWSYKLNVSAIFLLQKRKLFQAMWQYLM